MVLDPGQLVPPLPDDVMDWQEQWPPVWWVLRRRQVTAIPPFFNPDMDPQGRNWWSGVLGTLHPLLGKCTSKPTWEQFKEGLGLGPHPTNPHLHTKCCTVGRCSSWLSNHEVFKLRPHGKHGKSRDSVNRGYMMVKARGMEDNTSEFYLHTLLCWAYYGPPPPNLPNPVAGHLCHHKLCLCPWHLAWMEQGTNVQMWWDHVKQLDYA